MTKDEALKAMKQGKKVSHMYFSADEYIHIVDGQMYAEDGCRFEEGWAIRTESVWQDGWRIIE